MKTFTLPNAGSGTPREFGNLNPFIIAEIGVNHEGSLERAKNLISSAAEAGAHAAKFQTYTAEKLAARSTSPSYWDTSKEPTKSQYELFQRHGTFGEAEYRALSEHCGEVGIEFMSTPFDLEAVGLLDPLMTVTKVASADLTNVPLLRRIRMTGKPVIMSVGAATHDEIRWAVDLMLGDEGSSAPVPQLTLLHCVLNYPTPHEAAQLGQISRLRAEFGDRVSIGYSDHVCPQDDGTMPSMVLAVIQGAVVLEKHFTDDKQQPGNDHYHAMDAADLAVFTELLRTFRTLWGSDDLDLGSQTRAIENARRRVIAARSLSVGHVITEGDLIALRSNEGIEIAQWDRVIGTEVVSELQEGEPVSWGSVRVHEGH